MSVEVRVREGEKISCVGPKKARGKEREEVKWEEAVMRSRLEQQPAFRSWKRTLQFPGKNIPVSDTNRLFCLKLLCLLIKEKKNTFTLFKVELSLRSHMKHFKDAHFSNKIGALKNRRPMSGPPTVLFSESLLFFAHCYLTESFFYQVFLWS